MRLLSNKNLVLKLYPKGANTWTFQLPTAEVQVTDKRDRIKVFVSSLVCRNDFQVIYPGRDTIVINGLSYTIRNGNPSVLALAAELNKITPDLVFSFDSYDGSFYVANQTANPYVIGPGTLGFVLGFASEMSLQPLTTIRLGTADVAPPSETIVVRQLGLSDQGFEIDEEIYENKGLLSCIGCSAPPYGTFSYRDPMGGSAVWWNQPSLLSITLTLENIDGESLISANTVTVVYCVQIWRDDSDTQLETLQGLAETSKLQLMGQSLK